MEFESTEAARAFKPKVENTLNLSSPTTRIKSPRPWHGVLRPPQRTLGGHRLYSPDAVMVRRVIKAAQRLGFTLEEISELIEVGRHHHGKADAGLQARAGEKLREVESRIAGLQEIRATLKATLDAGCDDIVQCAGSDCCPLPFKAAMKPITRRQEHAG